MNFAERTASNYTTIAVEEIVAAVAVMMVVAEATASSLMSSLLPSCSMYLLSFLGASHML